MTVKELKYRLSKAEDIDEVYAVMPKDNPVLAEGSKLLDTYRVISDKDNINGFYIMTE